MQVLCGAVYQREIPPPPPLSHATLCHTLMYTHFCWVGFFAPAHTHTHVQRAHTSLFRTFFLSFSTNDNERTHARVHTHTHTHARTYTCTHTRTHARTHARTHTYTHTHTHTHKMIGSLLWTIKTSRKATPP